ncbi:hypothetical protein IT571_11460, partial [Candidatus Sumerlaeota bacterium]|nr:hypothetical protein [Candidatus Sumerlaeota bacterium]
ANTQAKFNAWIVGADPQRINASLFDLLINNKPVAAGEARTGRVENKAVSFESSQLVEGINTLSVSNPEQTDASKSNPFRFIMAEFTLPITSLGLKPQTLFTADFDAPTTYSVLLAKQDNFRGGGYAFDVTKPLEPLVINLAGQTNPLQYTAFLRVPAAGTQFLYAPAETYFVPPPFQSVKAPRSFVDDSQIDYLAIYYPELFNELRPLLDYRAKSMSVASYSVDDVYAAFSYGEISYQAIHDCIAHIFRARKAPRLREVLLVGEGSEYWWEYRRDSPGVSRNMIPVFGWQDPSVRIRGDESYALITGMGPIADVEIARISVNDPEEMKIVTDKILGYDTNPPTGEWRNRHLFVTDDEPDFISVARAIVRKAFLPPHAVELLKLQDFPYEDYFRGIWRKRSAEFTDRVIGEMSRGALTVTYLGHGGPNLWSSERILHIRDIDRMTDSGRHPFLIAGSCDTGWVDYPVEPVRASLSEHFIRRKNGGMIGAFIPIDGTSSYEHDYLISAFYEHLCHDKITDFGTLCLLSKLDYYLDRNNPSVTNQYLLMGDPASNLPPMPAPLDAKVEPARILSATGRVLKITGRTDGYDHASGRVVVTDTTNLPIAESRFIVRSGDINTTVGIPAYLAPGSYNVLVETSNDEAKKSQLASLPLAVQESKVTLSWDTTPDASTVIEAGKPLQIRFKVRNETDLEIPNAQIVIDDVEKRKELARFPVTVAVGDNTTPPLEKSFPAGVTTVRGRLIIPSEDKEQLGDVLGESQLVLRAQSDQVRYLDFPLDAVAVSRLPQNAGTQFTIPVYNMTNLALPKLEAVLKRINATESVPLGDPLIIESLKPTESRSLTFNTTSVYTDSKPTNFLLELYDLSGDRRRLLQLTPFTYSFKSGPDVAIVPGSFISESENIFAGRTVYLRFSVVNNGDEVARNVRGLAYLNEPWVEKNAVPTSLVWFPPDSVDELYPGEKHTFRLRWDPTNGSSTTPVVFAAVKVNGTPGDVNLENNTLRKEFDFLAAPNLALTKDQLFVSSKFLKPYERVTVRVPFTNNSTQDFVRDFRMSVYAVGQRATRDRIAMRRFPGLKAGESALMQFDWGVKPGQYTLSFSLNEDREYLEDTYDDNTMTITMPYIVGDGEFGTDTNVWDFSSFPDFGMMHGVVRAPDGSISVSARPDAMMQTMPFNSDYLIEGALGDQAKSDNLWGNLGGHLYLTFSETGPPVKFRMPVPDPDTNWYDVYFQSVGDYEPEQMSGDFKYRFEDNKNWALETRPTVGRIYMGRYDVRDGYLDFEISGPDYPSLNDISSISMAPVAGIYESPIIQLAKPLNASLVVDQETPRTTRIEYSLRFGLRSGDGITWQDWRPLVAGDKVVSPAGTNVTQWRATLYGGKEGEPVLKSVRFELNDHDNKPGAEIAAEDGNK